MCILCVRACSPQGFGVTGLRDTWWSNARDACDKLLLMCCPYVRDLRNCCYRFVEICFAEIWAWYLTCYGKLKKECYDMQEMVKTIQVRQNQNQSWQKKGAPTNKIKANNMKLMLRLHYCKLNSIPINNKKMILWVVVWQTILEKTVCAVCRRVCVCYVRCVSGPRLECTTTSLQWQPASTRFSNRSSDHRCAILFIPY